MRQRQVTVQSILSNFVVYFLAGASFLCILSTIQKVIISAPLVLQGYMGIVKLKPVLCHLVDYVMFINLQAPDKCCPEIVQAHTF